ncbi:MAG TPA: AAA family ATPase [Nocardioides sp.]|uniref:ATP-binding protein n=1 Tax=Nocardioides sp. TaxID=35761 RepID=UPI002E352242|nr:AAA family ATPase [Nocardioides sp.]HEX5089361.1 AAA family ATPase [Nocardioides sp.]
MSDASGARMVGRGDHLRTLHAALARATEGEPTAVLVAGELGVGKTRLVKEFLATVDAEVFAGACVPVVGEPLPYAALTQALRGGSALVRQEVQRSPVLARLLPGGSADIDETGTGEAAGSGAASRLRLFQAVLALLGRLSAVRPVVHVVEDVQWADRSTLDLLAFLATNFTDERVLVVLTLRTDTADDARVSRWLAELGRHWPVTRLPVGRLDHAEVAELVAQLRGGRPAERLDALVARSAGNPLFVEQLALVDDDAPLPDTLQELLHTRVAELPEETRRALGGAAVLGRPTTLPVLARTLGVSEEGLDEALRPALAAHVAELRPDLRVDFHHPAFREVVDGELMPRERIRLHLGAAEALAEIEDRAPAVVGEMARHWHRAGDLPRALTASVRAGGIYVRLQAFADAHAAYERVLELVEEVPNDLDLVQVRLKAADAANLAGESERALALLDRVRAEATDPTTRAEAAARIGAIHFRGGDGAAAEAAFRDALALLPAGERSVRAARVRGEMALQAVGWSRFDEAELLAAEALRIATDVGARREEGVARNAQGTTAGFRGDLDRAVELLRTALEIAREVQDPQDLGSAYVNLSHVLGMAGRLEENVELGRIGIVELTRVGQERQQGSLLLNNVSEQLAEAGRLEEAGELVADALSRHPRGIQAAPLLRLGAELALINGDLTTAWERCEQARLIVESESAPVGWVREVIETAAEIELWAQRPEAAHDLVLEGLELVAGTDDEAFAGTLVALGLRALADQAAVHRDHRSRVRRADQRERLLDARTAVSRHRSTGAMPQGHAQQLWLSAELARLDEQPAAELWAGSADAWTEVRRRFLSAYARWREAEARLGAGVDAEAVAALRAAHDAARSLGAVRLVDEVETLARWYRIDLLPPASQMPAGDAAGDPLAAYGLTERERQVLVALAAGRSNREIAEELVISSKTASVHVSNILRKLDVSGRQEAARIAHRLGVTA